MIPWPWLLGIGLPSLALAGLLLYARSLRAKCRRAEALAAVARADAARARADQIAHEAAWQARSQAWAEREARVREALTGSTSDAKGLRDDLEACIAGGSADHAHAWLERVFTSRRPGAAKAPGAVPAELPDGPGTAAHRRGPGDGH